MTGLDPRTILNLAYVQDNLGPARVLPAEHFTHQKDVILYVCKRLIDDKSRGIILADEVGLGKTFEALWTAYFHYLSLSSQDKKDTARILIVVPPKLLMKWVEELEKFSEHIERIERSLPLDLVEKSSLFRNYANRAYILDVRKGKSGLQVNRATFNKKENGIYILKETLLSRVTHNSSREYRSAKMQFSGITWDLVCFDEAHRYAKGGDGEGNNRSAAAKTFCESVSAKGTKIILCTATPFQLDTHELEGLIGLINSNAQYRRRLEIAIDEYNNSVKQLREIIIKGEHVDVHPQPEDRLNLAKKDLEQLLCPWIVRSRRPEKEGLERRTHEVTDVNPGRVFPWLYWKVRDWICEPSSMGNHRTFVPTTLHMMISSTEAMRQHLSSMSKKNGMNPTIHKGIINYTSSAEFVQNGHPKLEDIAGFLLRRIEETINEFDGDPSHLINHKCVVFCTYTETIKSLLKTIRARADEKSSIQIKMKDRTIRALESTQIDYDRFKKELRNTLSESVLVILDELNFHEPDKISIWDTKYESQTDNEYRHLLGIQIGYHEDLSIQKASKGESLKDMLLKNLNKKFSEPLLEYDLVQRVISKHNHDVSSWQVMLKYEIRETVTMRLKRDILRIHRSYFGTNGRPVQPREWLRYRLSRFVYSISSRKVAEALMGETDMPTRQQIINSFNYDLFPLILICSSVAEEGIDLQKQCNTVIHYDLEWNPAKVEQREGRVDRLGGSNEVTVEFKRLARTYDERIYNRFNNRRIWMDLYLCSKWIEEGRKAEEEDPDNIENGKIPLSEDMNKLIKFRLDLRPPVLDDSL